MKLLPGRIAIRPIVPMRTGLVWHPDQRPDTERSEDRQLGKLAQSSHRGRVLGMGTPAVKEFRRSTVEVSPGFDVGDEVFYVFGQRGTEESRRGTWSDGEPCVWIAQEEVIAVLT